MAVDVNMEVDLGSFFCLVLIDVLMSVCIFNLKCVLFCGDVGNRSAEIDAEVLLHNTHQSIDYGLCQ